MHVEALPSSEPAARVLRLWFVGDIVGSPGRRVFAATAKRLRGARSVHVIVANAENAAAGNGITQALAKQLMDAGADMLTLGDHTWNQKEIEGWLGGERAVLRPANYAPAAPGHGWGILQTSLGPLAVICLQGRVFMNPADCPFRAVDALLAHAIPRDVPVVVDFHAEATSEKIAMGRYLDGRVAAVLGTHTHVQTSDEGILSGGTAYMTDLGMTGPSDSVLGRDVTAVLKRFTTGLPARFAVAEGPAVIEGAMVGIDMRTRRAISIERFREREHDRV